MADENGYNPSDTGHPETGAPTSRKKPSRRRRYAEASPEERRRLRMRLVANIIIVGAVLGLLAIVLYFVGTWLYTSRQQDALRDQLAIENPDLAAAEQNATENDFVFVGTQTSAFTEPLAKAAAELKRQLQLAALKSAADDYEDQIKGQVGRGIGTVLIPSIGVDSVMVEGDFAGAPEDYLRKGPGHWPETPLPGQGGSVVVSGHRTTYGAPFRKLNELKPGDEIELVLPYAIIKYTVTQVIIVLPTEVGTVAYQGKEQLSLVACHPLHSATHRIIAQADMSSFVLVETGQ